MTQSTGFHLYLLIGQSNMAGRGKVDSQEPHPRVFMLNKECEWVPAIDPLHFDKPVMVGVGPGLAFGKHMAEHDPSVQVGLIPAAAGGSPIRTWQPGGYWEQTHSHPYDDAIMRTRAAMQSGVLKGILWHQGESDANPDDAPLYEDRLAGLIQRLRSDLGMTNVPFVSATLADYFIERRAEGQVINATLRGIPERVTNTACAESAGLGHMGDDLHFSSEASRELGRRYAEAMIQLQTRLQK